MSEFELEKNKLKETIEKVKSKITEENDNLEKTRKNFIGEIEDLWRIIAEKKVHIDNLIISSERPYFARIDFISDETNQKQTIYIGKNGISDKYINEFYIFFSELNLINFT